MRLEQMLVTGHTCNIPHLHLRLHQTVCEISLRSSLAQTLGVEPWSAHLTWVWGKQQGKRARLQEAGLWRGEPPDSGFWGGAGTNFLAMDLVQPQVSSVLGGERNMLAVASRELQLWSGRAAVLAASRWERVRVL